MAVMPAPTFGDLLKQLRKRAGMTQRDLAAALGYSDSLISGLEKAQRQPDFDAVMQRFIPALGLQDDAKTATKLIEAAAFARGQALPSASVTVDARNAPATTVSAATAPGLPALPVALIGRDDLIYQLSNRLCGHQGRLLTLVGAAGGGQNHVGLGGRCACATSLSRRRLLCAAGNDQRSHADGRRHCRHRCAGRRQQQAAAKPLA